MALTIIKHPAKLILSKQPVAFTVDSTNAGTPLRIKANISGSTDADSVAVDVNGQAEFELSDYLQALISVRHKTTDVPSLYSNNPAVVQVEFRELVGSPAVVGDQIVSDPNYALDGYVPASRRKALYSEYPTLLAYLNAKSTFLTWYPAAELKLVDVDQKEFVNYLQSWSEAAVNITPSFILHFTDGVTYTKSLAPVSVDYMQMLYIPAGYTQLDIQTTIDLLFSNKTLDYYEVKASGMLNGGLKKQSFKIDPAYRENKRILYIRNAFGLLEIVRCTGKGDQNNKLTIEIARTDGRILPDKISWKSEHEDVVKANTGNLSKAQMKWLSDMDFTEAYELQGAILHPIVFHDLDLPVIHDDVYQYSAELEYKYAYNKITEEG